MNQSPHSDYIFLLVIAQKIPHILEGELIFPHSLSDRSRFNRGLGLARGLLGVKAPLSNLCQRGGLINSS